MVTTTANRSRVTRGGTATQRRAEIASAAVVVIGTLMPWATVFIVSVSGVETDWGKVTIALAALGALAAWRSTSARLRVAAPLLIVATCAWFIQHVESWHAAPGAIQLHVILGSGLYVSIAASLVWLALAALAAYRAVTDENEA